MLCLILTVAVGCAAEKQTERNTNKEPIETTDKQQNDELADLVWQIFQKARQGKIINCEFPVETTVIDTVKKEWGNPTHENYIAAAKGTYATYTKQKVTFGYNKGSQIFDVRCQDNILQQVTMSKVKEVLGPPDNTHHYTTEDMLVYQVNEKYQLLFIFPKVAEQNSEPVLSHYNVFYPRGTVNSMAGDPGIKY